MRLARAAVPMLLLALALPSCHPHGGGDDPPVSKVHRVANGCFTLAAVDPGRWVPQMLSATEAGEGYAFSFRWPWRASRFFLKPSRLGTYLLYDEAGAYVVAEGGDLLRRSELQSAVRLVDDGFESPAEWALESVGRGPRGALRLRHRRSGQFLSTAGLVEDPRAAASLHLYPARGCAEHPEASLDASGRVRRTRFEDGSLFGIADTHSHVLSNFAFGGGGIFHGAPFHPLGVEHALADCENSHGEDGRSDFIAFGFSDLGDLDGFHRVGIGRIGPIEPLALAVASALADGAVILGGLR